jgi:hypothetical protein
MSDERDGKRPKDNYLRALVTIIAVALVVVAAVMEVLGHSRSEFLLMTAELVRLATMIWSRT